MAKQSTAEARIRSVVEERAGALRRKDAAALIACHTDDLVLYSLAPPLRADIADTAGLAAWFASWDGPIGYEIRDLAVTVADAAGFCHGLVRMSGTKAGGQPVALWFRHTLCLRLERGDWRIAHVHDSVPFYMDGSLRAAVDLAP